MTQPFFLSNKYVYNYNRILFTLNELPKIARSKGPKFVYAHMLIPHRPNIFLPDGSMNLNTDYYKKGVGEGINRQYDIEGYINNTQFINNRLRDNPWNYSKQFHHPDLNYSGDHGRATRYPVRHIERYFSDRNYALYPKSHLRTHSKLF
jgi:hypothetical protein